MCTCLHVHVGKIILRLDKQFNQFEQKTTIMNKNYLFLSFNKICIIMIL